MLIEHSFTINSLKNGKNEIFVHIKPTVLEAREYANSIDVGMLAYSYEARRILEGQPTALGGILHRERCREVSGNRYTLRR